jgi:hypothetical protein
MPHGLGDAEWNADGIGDDERDDAIENGDRETLLDQLPHRVVIPRRVAEIELQHAPQPLPVTDQDRLVEAVVGLQLSQLFFVESIAGAGPAGAAIALRERGLRHHAFDRPAGHHARDREYQQCNADEGGDDEQQASDEITDHAFLSYRQPPHRSGTLTSLCSS